MIILATSKFDKSVQKLAKKYPSIPEDLLVLKAQLLLNPTEGTPLGKNCFKLRINISSKKQGKSGGARIITYVKITDKKITLLDIYDKSEKDSITDKDLKALIKKAE